MDRLKQLRQSLTGDTGFANEHDDGIGLYSTVIRLFIHYRGKEHFQIKSGADETIIEIGGMRYGSEY